MLNIKLNREKFLNNIKIVENAIIEDKAEGINTGIFVEAKDDSLTLKAHGEGLFIKAKMDCQVIEPGEFVIKHRLMQEFLRQLEIENIEIKETTGKISIASGTNSSEFAIYQYQNTPEPQVNSEVEFLFNRQQLLEDIEKVRFAASTSIEKLVVNCLRLEIEKDKFNLVSSDAHRLIYINGEYENSSDENLGISIPLRTINSLIKTLRLSNEDEKIILKTSDNRLLFKLNNVEIITKLVEIPYPDYKSLLKSIANNKVATINANEFISILKRIYVFVKDNTDKKDIAIFDFSKDGLEIEGKNDYATTKERLDVMYEGEKLKIALNVKYIIDYLSTNVDEKLIELKLNTERTPVLFNFKNSVYLIAPTQV